MTKILLPITNTLDADALLYAEGVAVEKGATLVVLYITSPLTVSTCYAYPSLLYSVANLNMDSIETAHQSLSIKIKSILTRCPNEVICLIGPQVDSIVSVLKEQNIDLIILPEEQHMLGKLAQNSNKNKIEKKSDVPVMVYKKHA